MGLSYWQLAAAFSIYNTSPWEDLSYMQCQTCKVIENQDAINKV